MRAGGVGFGPRHDFGQFVGGLEMGQRIVGRQAIGGGNDAPARHAPAVKHGRRMERQDDGRTDGVFRRIAAGGDAAGNIHAQQAFRHPVALDQLHGKPEKLLRGPGDCQL